MKKILIVDNSVVIRDMLKNLFVSESQITIFEANSLREAQELITNHKFFVVVSNVVLSDSQNFELKKH